MPPARSAAVALLAGAAVAVGLFRGGVPAEAQAAACLAAGAALLLAALGEPQARPLRPGPAFLAPLLVLAVALAQCLPLPAGLLSRLAPLSWELRSFPPAPVPSFAPLTLDLWATLASLAPALTAACALAAAGLLARHPRLRPWLCAAPVAAALLQVAWALVRLAGEGVFAGAFVNRNHFAGLLALGALCALGATLDPPVLSQGREAPRRSARVLWAAAATVCAAGVLLTLSRGGALGLGAGSALLAVRSCRRHARARSGRAAPALGLLLLAALAGAVALSPDGGLGHLRRLGVEELRTEGKLRSFAGALAVVADHPLTGVGRGAWRFLADRHRTIPGDEALVYVEDEPLQLAAEEGLPAAAAVLLLACGAWLLALWRPAGGLEDGVRAGALALFLHNLVDFNLAFPGVALPLAVAFGAAAAPVQGQPGRHGTPPGRIERLRLPRASAWAACAGAIAAAALVLAAPLRQAEAEAQGLLLLAADARVPSDALLERARAMVTRHPADWLVSLAPAIGLLQRSPRRTAEALAWTGRAQLLAPRSFRTHAVAAAVLARAGRLAQARLEVRLSIAGPGAGYQGETLALLVALCKTPEDLLEATPEDAAVRARVVAWLRWRNRADLALQLAEAELARLGPGAAAAPADAAALASLHQERARLLLQRGEPAEALEVVERHGGGSCEARSVADQARAALGGDPALQERGLLATLAACPGDRDAASLLVHGRLARRDWVGAAALLDQPGIGGPAVAWSAEAHLWRAEALEGAGRPGEGLRERWLAARLAPDRLELGFGYAERLLQQGDRLAAIVALRDLALLAPPESRAAYLDRASQLERRRR